MEFALPNQLAKVLRVVSDEHSVFIQTPAQDGVVGVAGAPHVARTDRVVTVVREAVREGRRQALVHKEAQRKRHYRNRFGRPRRGWVRA